MIPNTTPLGAVDTLTQRLKPVLRLVCFPTAEAVGFHQKLLKAF